MTIKEFLDLAFDNTYPFEICDIGKAGEIIFSTEFQEELPEDVEDMELHSWGLENGKIVLNVDSEEED